MLETFRLRAARAAWLMVVALGAACRPHPPRADETPLIPPVPGGMQGGTLKNRFAYIPAECYTATRDGSDPKAPVHNPCFVCHTHPTAPNFVDDAELQLAFRFPGAATTNPWRNLFAPPIARAPRVAETDVMAYVRRDNYRDAAGHITLSATLGKLPPAWDGQGDHRWDGYIPDAWFRFDDRGFDRDADGRPSGWRAFAYTPFMGTFFPTNGSMDDVLVRLAPSLREDSAGRSDETIYELNLAIVEALITRADVPIDAVDEATVGADLDLDGVLGRATRVVFRAPKSGRGDLAGTGGAAGNGGGNGRARAAMHYVGRARAEEGASFPLEAGLFPLGTEFLHSVRYLDVAADGEVTMAARMKELRYAKKVRWLSPADLRAHAAAEATEQNESADGVVTFLWQFDRGIYNGQGWLLQGFIEAADGSLRPESYEESVTCAGCHGGLGATTDSMFAFARKLGGRAPRRGWFHFSQHGLRGLAEPRSRDGAYEYSRYLVANGAGDDLRENDEIEARFFDGNGRVREAALVRLHDDISTLLVPSAARALALDRAYLAIVREQSFVLGRDTVLGPSRRVRRHVPAGELTGIAAAIPRAATPPLGVPP